MLRQCREEGQSIETVSTVGVICMECETVHCNTLCFQCDLDTSTAVSGLSKAALVSYKCLFSIVHKHGITGILYSGLNGFCVHS